MKSARFLKASFIASVTTLLCSFLVAEAQENTLIFPHVPSAVRSGQAAFVGSVDNSQRLQLTLSLPLRDEAALDTLLQQIYDPQSPNFHHYLSTQEFTDRFAPTQQDYDAVVAWAQAKGLEVTERSPNRLVVNVDGTVANVNRAFNVLVNSYHDSATSRVFRAPDREPTVDLPVQLLAVSGLDDSRPPHSHYRKGDQPSRIESHATETSSAIAHILGSGPGNTYLPSDMRKAYYGSGPLTGTGQTVAIFSFDGYIASDLNLYYSSTGMTSSVPVNNVLVNGYSGACWGFNANGTINNATCDDGEQILDIVNVIGMAPGLTQVLFYESNSANAALNRIASDNIAKVISSSWGGGDFGLSSTPIFKEFQAQGQTYLNATGDDGQFNSSTYDAPSVDANITQVGGTDLITAQAGGAWASETSWSDSGGGFMTGTAIPSYQQLAGVINSSNLGSTTLRNAPDVAAEANFDNTTVISGKFESGYGGTSFAAPRWAGLIALANQAAVANGNGPIGFLNPTIYNIGIGSNYTANFHDIVIGKNAPSAGAGTGFNAVAGYDLVTGWGSPNGPALIATLAGTTATPDYSLSAAPSSLSVVAGASGTSTITVTPISGFSGSVALTASGLPTGVTASFSPASTTGTSTLTLTAASTATVGLATVTITGVSGTLTHTATVALTVTAAPNYSLSASPSSLNLARGTSGSSTISVAGVNGFSGSVALTASGLPAGVTASFSPASTTGTSILTLTASSVATVGLATVTITGTSGSLTHTTTVALTVTATPDYSLSSSPSSLSVVAGTSGVSTISVTGINGFAGSVALSASGLPAGVTASFSPASTTGASILTLTASTAATAGLATVTITGVSGGLTHNTAVALTITPAPDYSLSSSPSSLSVVAGTSGSSTITVVGINSFSGAVSLAASGLPAGVTASFSPASTTGTSILTLTASSTAVAGLSTITITGTSGSLTHTATVALTVTAAPDYSLSALPSSLSVVAGTSGNSTISVTGINSFSGSVALAASGLPAGVTASFSPASTTGTSTLTLTASSTATLGLSTVTITGTSGSLTHTTTVALTVTAAPNYSLSASSSSLSIAAGSNGASTITVNGLNGFSGSVALAASGLPAGVTASFSPSSTAGTSVLTLTVASTATVGLATVTITGTSGSLTHTATVALTVTSAPDYSLSALPVSVVQGTSGTSTITVTGINSFSGFVALTASGLPAGVTASFSPASTTGTSVLTLTVASTATAGLSHITITGTSGSLMHTATVALTVLVPDYSLSSSPSNLSVVSGTNGSASSTITVTDLNGFSGAVSLTATGLPLGVTASFSPKTTTSISTLTLTTLSYTPTGPATITITGVSGGLVHTTTVVLTVTPAPDYSLSLSPARFSIPQGSSASNTVTVTGINGFAGSVDLSVSGLPAGVTASFSPASTTGTSALTLTAANTAAAGSQTITISGTSGGVSHQIYISLAITASPNFSLSASPSSVSVVQGSSGTSVVSVSDISGFNDSVTLTASGLPSGVTASFSAASTTSTSSRSVLTLTASSTATVGTAIVTITGISGSLTQTATVILTVTQAGDYSLSASPVSVVQNSSGTSTVAVMGVGGFSSSVALTASGLPAGVTASFSPSNTTGTSILTLIANSTTTVGLTSVTITGTSGTLIHSTTLALTVKPAPSYSLSASTGILGVVPGSSSGSMIVVKGVNGFNGSVALAAVGLPAGVTASFSPANTTDTSMLTLTAASTASAGSATVTVTGTSGSLTQATTIALTIVPPPAPDYSLSSSSSSLNAPLGVYQTDTIQVTGVGGFNGVVALKTSGLPPGVTAWFSSASTTGATILTVSAAKTATVGPATLTITGTSGKLVHTTTIALNVTVPDYSLSASTSSLSVVAGTNGTSTISVAGTNSFAGYVTLGVSGLPAGVTASLSPTGITTSTTSTLTLKAASTAAKGTTMVTITGVSGSLTHTTTVALTVQ